MWYNDRRATAEADELLSANPRFAFANVPDDTRPITRAMVDSDVITRLRLEITSWANSPSKWMAKLMSKVFARQERRSIDSRVSVQMSLLSRPSRAQWIDSCMAKRGMQAPRRNKDLAMASSEEESGIGTTKSACWTHQSVSGLYQDLGVGGQVSHAEKVNMPWFISTSRDIPPLRTVVTAPVALSLSLRPRLQFPERVSRSQPHNRHEECQFAL